MTDYTEDFLNLQKAKIEKYSKQGDILGHCV